MKSLLLILFFIIGLSSLAQPPRKFYSTYGGNGYDVGYDVKQTLDGGYIITGSTSSYGQGNTDMYLLKIDSMGQKVFQKTFGGVNNEIGKSIVQLADSSYVMAGYTSSSGFGGYDVFLVKADKIGNLIWQKTIGGADWDFANSLQATTDNGFIICGTTYSFGNGNADGYIIKTDANGDTTWTKTYGGLKDDEFKSVIQTADGNYAVTGYTKSYNDSLGDGWIFRIDQNGDSIFSKSVGGLYSDVFNNVIELPNTNLYFVGANKSLTAGINTVNWLYLTDNTNAVIVNTFVGNTNTERYNSSAVGINGTIVSVGYNNFMNTTSDANIHVFTNSLGYVAYYPFGVDYMDELFSVSKTKDKGFVGIGTSSGNTTLLSDLLFVKTDSLGHYGTSIVGIKESKSTDITLNIYPNPTSEFLNIEIYRSQDLKELNFRMIDISGKIVLSSGITNSKNHFNISDFLPGLYFIQIYSSNKLLNSSKISVVK